jgi:hypothetical protein
MLIFNNNLSEPAGHKVIQDEEEIMYWILLVWG